MSFLRIANGDGVPSVTQQSIHRIRREENVVGLLILLQAVPASPPEVNFIAALLTWAPVIALGVLFWFLTRRMGYFSKKNGYVKRCEDHMERVEQTLLKIEGHLRVLAERENRG